MWSLPSSTNCVLNTYVPCLQTSFLPHTILLCLIHSVLAATLRHNNSNSRPLCNTGGWRQRHPPFLIQQGGSVTLFTVGHTHTCTHTFTPLPNYSFVQDAAPNTLSFLPLSLCSPNLMVPTEEWREINSWLILHWPSLAYLWLISKPGNKGPLGTGLRPARAPSSRPELQPCV